MDVTMLLISQSYPKYLIFLLFIIEHILLLSRSII